MTKIQRLSFNNTKVSDVSPLVQMADLQTLWIWSTPADLLPLVAKGAAWADDNKALSDLVCSGLPAARSGGYLEHTVEADHSNEDRTAKTLDALRAERDRLRDESQSLPQIAQKFGYIFLSYSRADANAAKTLREALAKDGVAIWQDVDMAIGKRFRSEIDARIDGAAGVLTLWSQASIASDYVASEAERGRLADKLAPAVLAPLTPPPPFDGFNTANLSGWSGDRTDADYQRLLSSLRSLLASKASAAPTPPK